MPMQGTGGNGACLFQLHETGVKVRGRSTPPGKQRQDAGHFPSEPPLLSVPRKRHREKGGLAASRRCGRFNNGLDANQKRHNCAGRYSAILSARPFWDSRQRCFRVDWARSFTGANTRASRYQPYALKRSRKSPFPDNPASPIARSMFRAIAVLPR